jgi:cell division protein FtsB
MRVLSPKLILSVAGVIVLFIMISLVQEMNRRLQVQREVAQLEGEARKLEKTIVEMENLNQYFRTDAFQERIAREKLNYRAEGEEVVLLPEDSEIREAPVVDSVPEKPVSNARQWWDTFFTSNL